jgi:hypothetical protein
MYEPLVIIPPVTFRIYDPLYIYDRKNKPVLKNFRILTQRNPVPIPYSLPNQRLLKTSAVAKNGILCLCWIRKSYV